MNSEHPYEKTRLRDRSRELLTLALFTVAIALISTVVMNLLVYPVSLFAIHRKEAFNIIIVNVSLYGLIGLLLFLLGRKVYRLRKDGLPPARILVYLLRRPAYYLGLFMVFLASSAVIAAFLYFLLSFNYYYLFKLTNN